MASRVQLESLSEVRNISPQRDGGFEFAHGLPCPERVKLSMLGLGAGNDEQILPTEVEVTARAYGIWEVIVPNLAPQMMLDPSWSASVERLLDWLSEQGL